MFDFNNMPQVDLDKELQANLQDGPMGKMIHHPLLIEIFYIPQHNFRYNKILEMKKGMVDEALKEKNWSQTVWLYERPYRINAFHQIQELLSDKEYWETLAGIFIDSENIWQNIKDWRLLLKSKRKGKQFFMTSEERIVYNNLPEKLEVYRGCIAQNANGISYTLSKEKAEWFAKRFNKKGYVKTRKVTKDQVFAYIGRRDEQEVILLSERRKHE